VGRAPAVLAVLTGIGLYYGFSEGLRNLSTWGDVAFLAVVLIPGSFLLIWLALPLFREAGARALAGAALGFGALAVVLELLGLDVAANFAKFAAVTAAGWWFLTFFETVNWVLLVALLIVPIDTYSVFQGPTKVIVEEQPQVFDALSIAWGLRNLPDYDSGIREMARVLKPDGRLVILEMTPLRNPTLRWAFNLYFEHAVPVIGGFVSGDREAYRYLPASVGAFPDADRLVDMMRAS
jgi:SAM-dependent methyltransferase